MLNMKISFELPDGWSKVIRQAALDTDCQSAAQFMKLLLANSEEIKAAMTKMGISELPSLDTQWGGSRAKEEKDTE